MKQINLRDYYPHYKEDKIVEVPDEVAALLEDLDRKEESYLRYLVTAQQPPHHPKRKPSANTEGLIIHDS